MSRALDTLKKIKVEIVNDPNRVNYVDKTPAEIAILLNQLHKKLCFDCYRIDWKSVYPDEAVPERIIKK